MIQPTPSRQIQASSAVDRIRRLLDGLLVGLLAVLAFLLGCQELFDADIWWHVAAGRWILEHGQTPQLDPFSFASADRRWIDLHWTFQVLVALANRWGGVQGIVLLASTLASGSVYLGLASRRSDCPVWLVAGCWLPALLVMSSRFDPRPELMTLLYMAAFLAVLSHADRRAGLCWLLVPVQLLWVNAHGLFILGPLILGAFVLERLLAGRGWLGEAARLQDKSSLLRLRSLGLVFAAVVLACFINPYGLQGVLFPLTLFPKISSPGNPYKEYIGEFKSLPSFVQAQSVELAARSLYLRAEYFLLIALPPSFLLPAVWDLWRRKPGPETPPRGSSGADCVWLGALALAFVMTLAGALGLPGVGTPRWLVRLGTTAPIGLSVLGILGAALLVRRALLAGILAILGGVFSAAWALWLRRSLIGPEPDLFSQLGMSGPSLPACVAIVAGALSLPLLVRGGASPFRLILAAAFGFLAFTAIRNANLFGLVSGVILAGNLGEWCTQVLPNEASSRSRRAGLVGRGVLVALGAGWLYSLLTGSFYPATGERRQFGFGEQPSAYAHQAAAFAGRPGMPARAFALDLRQAGVYVYHNGPQKKIFMDSRLEVPSRSTFEAYVWLDNRLNEGAPGWNEMLRRMGNPVVVLDHLENCGAEATLLSDPRWRCVDYDPVGSVFLPRTLTASERLFPTYDFTARHFANPKGPLTFSEPLAEAKALSALGGALLKRTASPWSLRIPVLLLACDRAREVLAKSPGLSSAWSILGNCYWNMEPVLNVRPPGPTDPWDPATGLVLAQSTYCYRQALARSPGDLWILLWLHDAFAKRRMIEARDRVARQLQQVRAVLAGRETEPRPRTIDPNVARTKREGAPLVAEIVELVNAGRVEAAAAVVEGQPVSLPGSIADPVAVTFLHLGDPDSARRCWESAVTVPSQALRLVRLAEADHVASDEAAAESHYRAGLDLDPQLSEGWFGLALLHAQNGRAAASLESCREGLKHSLTEAQREGLLGIERMIHGHAGGAEENAR